MCADLCTLFFLLWHSTQVSVAVAVFSWLVSDFGLWTLWQVDAGDVARVVLAAVPVVVASLLWQDRQVSLASRALTAR